MSADQHFSSSAVPEIETERLLLRRWREDDLEAYARIRADPEVMRYMGVGAMTRPARKLTS